MQAQGSQQVSLRTPCPIPGKAGSVRGFAGVAQLVEHLFCKQVVSGSIPLASSSAQVASAASNSTQIVKTSEGCPSGQREQAVNLPAHAYVGSNPTPSTKRYTMGMRRPQSGLRLPPMLSAGVTQLVESQFSKLKVDGSSPFSRSNVSSRHSARVAASALEQLAASALKPTRPASLVAGEASASTGAERTPVREHRSGAEAQPPAKIAGRRRNRNNVTTEIAHLAQMVEHVLGKDEVTSSILVVGSTSVQPQ
jgi:hypothetical protein